MVYAELGQLVPGLKKGRVSTEEIPIFKSVGLALQDIAVAVALFEIAKRCHVGTRLDPFASGVPLAETDIDASYGLNSSLLST